MSFGNILLYLETLYIPPVGWTEPVDGPWNVSTSGSELLYETDSLLRSQQVSRNVINRGFAE